MSSSPHMNFHNATDPDNCFRIYREEPSENWYSIYVDNEGEEMFIESNKGSKISLSELTELMGLLKEEFFNNGRNLIGSENAN